MAANVHLGKRAYIPDTYHFHREVAEEVYDLKGLLAQQEY